MRDIRGIAGTAAFMAGSILLGCFTAGLNLEHAMPVRIAAHPALGRARRGAGVC